MIGDHIRTLKSGRWTHAIDCGDETVILLAEDAAQPPRVRRGYRPEFVAGADAVEVVTHRERTFPAEEVVARAYSRLSDPALASMFRDSEAFAEWCTTGRPSTPASVAVSLPGVARSTTAAEPRARAAAKATPARKPKGIRRTRPARAAAAARKAKPGRKAGRAPARARKAAKRVARKPARRGARRPRR